MIPALIGVSVGILTILLATFVGKENQKVMYGLVLAGIGFLYVGFTWTDVSQLAVTVVQSLLFLLLAYYGATKSVVVLGAGFLLHGIWDVLYHQFTSKHLLPPHYDIFCFVVDVVTGGYILMFRNRIAVLAL